MKKLYLVAGMIALTSVCFAQQDAQRSSSLNDTLIKEMVVPQDRVVKLEQEVANLKLLQVEMQKQIAEIRSSIPAPKKKKPAVSRVGSKQLIWVEE